jgi:hypothetical protein
MVPQAETINSISRNERFRDPGITTQYAIDTLEKKPKIKITAIMGPNKLNIM